LASHVYTPKRRLTMRLSEVSVRRRPTKLIYSRHRLPSLAYRRCDSRSR
jgi:hypothetical protein